VTALTAILHSLIVLNIQILVLEKTLQTVQRLACTADVPLTSKEKFKFILGLKEPIAIFRRLHRT
jgi:hypothetical protein